MATVTQVQLRRGTSAQVATFTGAQGEVVVDTTNNRAVVHDGATAGGFALARRAEKQRAQSQRTRFNGAREFWRCRTCRAKPSSTGGSGGKIPA